MASAAGARRPTSTPTTPTACSVASTTSARTPVAGRSCTAWPSRAFAPTACPSRSGSTCAPRACRPSSTATPSPPTAPSAPFRATASPSAATRLPTMPRAPRMTRARRVLLSSTRTRTASGLSPSSSRPPSRPATASSRSPPATTLSCSPGQFGSPSAKWTPLSARSTLPASQAGVLRWPCPSTSTAVCARRRVCFVDSPDLTPILIILYLYFSL
mmetsp:Transcript_4923/g.15632  ORF Transcript_4923/g.15632 Transcript_4923/m.15632 type:complete len:215 (+) Transcript_4923:1082-1726(+)